MGLNYLAENIQIKLEENNISVKELNLLHESAADFSRMSFVISGNNIHSWDKVKNELNQLFKDQISIDDTLGAISLIGEGFSRDNKVVSETVSVIKKNNVEVFGLTTTSFRLSVLIKKEKVIDTAALLHKYWIISS